MTNLIDDIKRDLEAGTPGPWTASDWNLDDGPEMTTVGRVYKEEVTPRRSSIWPGGIAHERVAETSDGANPLADARRIARVPAMEDALLAAVTVLTECRDACLFDDDDGIGVSEDVVIPSDLFDQICAAINCKAMEETV